MPGQVLTPSDVHVNTPLTNLSIWEMQTAAGFVAGKVFPYVGVEKQSDRYYVINKGDFNRDEMQRRGLATESAGSGYRLDNTPTYFAEEWALHHDIPDQVRGNADSVLNMDMQGTSYLDLKALIRLEKIWIGNYFTTSKWTTDFTGVNSGQNGTSTFLRWNDAASTPIEDIRLAKRTILSLSGIMPNVITFGQVTYDRLVDHPDLIDRVKYGATPGNPAVVNRQALAALFEVEEVLVASAIENTAAEGQTATHAFIAGKHALLSYRASAPGLMTPSGGYTFAWTGQPGAGPQGQRISMFRMQQLKADRLEIEMSIDPKLTCVDLGVFFSTIVA